MTYQQQLKYAIEQVKKDGFKRYEYVQHIINRKNTANKICLYGTGRFFEGYAKNIASFDYVCDSDPQKWGKVFDGKTCISPDQLQNEPGIVVFIMAANYKEIQESLNQKGIENYYFGDLTLSVYDNKYDCEWFEKNEKDILDTLGIFEDDWSQKVYTNVICNRIAPQYAEFSFHDLEEPGEYFETGILKFGVNECFVDAGAFNGDSISAFIKAVSGQFEAIYGFEFDPINYRCMLENHQIISDKRIQLYQMGVSDCHKTMNIFQDGTGSHITNKGQKIVELYALDDILMDKRVTFIKMDVEGSEIDALLGCKNILNTQYPKLAISAYHKLDHLWKVPKYIKSVNTNYKIYMRHHAVVTWDTDCYAYLEG